MSQQSISDQKSLQSASAGVQQSASDQACFCLRIILALGIVFALGILYFGLISVAINQQFGKL